MTTRRPWLLLTATALALCSFLAPACGASSSLDADHLYTRIACPAGTADCDGRLSTGCETDLFTPESCGACGARCRDGQACTSGVCMAP